MKIGRINIYRITHIKNVSHILKYGVTHKDSPNANPNFVTIGDLSLIDTRSSRQISVDNGDISATIQTIALGDFIPFYFGVKMPMLYVIQNGGNFVERATNAEDIVYVVCSVQRIIESNLTYYFSDGHATDRLTTFYNKGKITDLPILIDWDSIKAPYWGGQENLNVKRKKQAEFLIADDISPDSIIGLGCYNEEARRNLINMGISENILKVIPNAYY